MIFSKRKLEMVEEAIMGFFGSYRWLSNFWLCKVVHNGLEYKSVEHAYQSLKMTNQQIAQFIRDTRTPGDAKRLAAANVFSMRKDWDKVKVAIMRQLLWSKFYREPLRSRLLQTGEARLVEVNYWGDVFWGVCEGKGRNELGKLIMEVRKELCLMQKEGRLYG